MDGGLEETVGIARSSFVAAPATAAWSPVAAIEVQLLGRFLVRRSGEEVPAASFGGRLVRVLIRLLVSRRGSFVSRDVLAEALWPERMPADPTTNLRVLVQRARAALGDAALIVTGSGGYSFSAADSCGVDTETFLVRVKAGRTTSPPATPAPPCGTSGQRWTCGPSRWRVQPRLSAPRRQSSRYSGVEVKQVGDGFFVARRSRGHMASRS
jgi:hypothetical protein